MEREVESLRMFRIWSSAEMRMVESSMADRHADRVLFWPIVLAVVWSAVLTFIARAGSLVAPRPVRPLSAKAVVGPGRVHRCFGLAAR